MTTHQTKTSFAFCCGFLLLSLAIFSAVIFQRHYYILEKTVLETKDIRPDSEMPPIFFVETSLKATLGLRETCAIEAAAAHHQNRKIRLYSLSPLSENDITTAILLSMQNIQVKILNLTLLFRGTPLEIWHQKNAIQDSLFPVEDISVAIRLALLWKNGGIHLDTDVITLRSLDGLSNAIGLQQPEKVSDAILVFDMAHPFLEMCLASYAQNHSKSGWNNKGLDLFTQVLKQMCDGDSLRDKIQQTNHCRGIDLHHEVSFYPISPPQWKTLFQPSGLSPINASLTYTVHLWGKLSRNTTGSPGSGCLLDRLMKDHCPFTYYLIKKQNKL